MHPTHKPLSALAVVSRFAHNSACDLCEALQFCLCLFMLPWPSNPLHLFCLTSWCSAVTYSHPHTTPSWKHLFFYLYIAQTSLSLEVDVLPDKEMCLVFVVSAISATAPGFKVRWIDLWLLPSPLKHFPLASTRAAAHGSYADRALLLEMSAHLSDHSDAWWRWSTCHAIEAWLL